MFTIEELCDIINFSLLVRHKADMKWIHYLASYDYSYHWLYQPRYFYSAYSTIVHGLDF